MRNLLSFFSIFLVCIVMSCVNSMNTQDTPLIDYELQILDISGNVVTEFSKDETVTFQLTIKNKSNTSFTDTFETSQIYNFMITKNCKTLWDWQGNKYFFPKISFITLLPNEKIIYSSKWPDEQIGNFKAGKYELSGEYFGSNIAKKSLSFSIID